MEIDKDDADSGAKPIDFRQHAVKRIIQGWHKGAALQVDNGNWWTVLGDKNISPMAGSARGIIERTNEARFDAEQLRNFLLIPKVIATGDHINARTKNFLGGPGRYAGTTRGVLAIRHDQVQGILLAQFGNQFANGATTRLADDITDEEHFHGHTLMTNTHGARDFDSLSRGHSMNYRARQQELIERRGLRYDELMSTFPVGPDKALRLAERMAALGVTETDLQESFVRSGGHGGQNVNKTSTCVLLVHGPTGLQVKCQATRQQGLNRFIARRLLLDKIEELRTGKVAAERARIAKIRRQKQRRSRRAKARVLIDKRFQSQKKVSRRKAGLD